IEENKTEDVDKLLRDAAEKGLEQITNKKYDFGIPTRSTKLVKCGIAFKGMRFKQKLSRGRSMDSTMLK
ncbi:7519_t:CDS:2, partial [Racocetra fulgida]